MSDRPPPEACAYAELLSAYLDGELDAAARRRLDAHLAEHEPCRAELAGLAAVRTAVRSLPWLDAPDVLWARLGVGESARPHAHPSRATGPRWHTWAASAAAVLMLMGGLAAARAGDGSPPAEQEAEPAAEFAEIRTGARTLASVVSDAIPMTTAGRGDAGDTVLDDAVEAVASFLDFP
jgi:anti-sigma factor RsiW